MLIAPRRLLPRFCSSSLSLPELSQANKLCAQGRLPQAIAELQRALQIMQAANLNHSAPQAFVDAVLKVSAAYVLTSRYRNVGAAVGMATGLPISDHQRRFMGFVVSSGSVLAGERAQSGDGDIRAVVEQFLRTGQTDKNVVGGSGSLPVLSRTAAVLNNAASYQKLLMGLVERSPKAQKANQIRQQLQLLNTSTMPPQTQLLYLTSLLLGLPDLTSKDKQFINTHFNSILKQYQVERPNEVHKPLTCIILSLIAQKHYMSAEGIVGHVRGEENPLLNGNKNMGRVLIDNIYRMLVTRANNEPFESGWAKEQPLQLGTLAVERLLMAPLLGHSLTNLIC